MDRETAVKQLVAIRAGVGAAAWIAPRLSGKAFGLKTDDNPQAPYLGRLFGARDVALAYGTMNTSGEDQNRWLVAALGCDIADAAAGVAAWRAGYLSTLSSVLVTAAALNGVALGLVALRSSGGGGGAPATA
jgi:hypothetical protein